MRAFLDVEDSLGAPQKESLENPNSSLGWEETSVKPGRLERR